MKQHAIVICPLLMLLAACGGGGGGGGTPPSAANLAPVAVADVAETDRGASVVVDVLSNDHDPEKGLLTLAIQTMPSNGSARVEGNKLVYQPKPGFYGTDTGIYQVSDAQGASTQGQYSITVHNVLAIEGQVRIATGVSATVNLWVGANVLTSSASDAAGAYRLKARLPSNSPDAFVQLRAEGGAMPAALKMRAYLGPLSAVSDAAGDDAVLTENEVSDVVISPLTTAEAAYMARNIASSEEWQRHDLFTEYEISERAAAMRVVAEHNLPLPNGAVEIWPLLADPNAFLDLTASLMKTHQAAYSSALNDASKALTNTAPLTRATLPSELTLAHVLWARESASDNETLSLKFNMDGTGVWIGLLPKPLADRSFTWDLDAAGEIRLAGRGMCLSRSGERCYETLVGLQRIKRRANGDLYELYLSDSRREYSKTFYSVPSKRYAGWTASDVPGEWSMQSGAVFAATGWPYAGMRATFLPDGRIEGRALAESQRVLTGRWQIVDGRLQITTSDGNWSVHRLRAATSAMENRALSYLLNANGEPQALGVDSLFRKTAAQPVNKERLLGGWKYSFTYYQDVLIQFAPDGRLTTFNVTGDKPVARCTGTWSLNDGRVTATLVSTVGSVHEGAIEFEILTLSDQRLVLLGQHSGNCWPASMFSYSHVFDRTGGI